MPRPTVIIDTVGFVRKLPHHLVASFRSTMEEAVAADLVLHVIDASHPQQEEQAAVGGDVLRDLGIPADRVIEVYNKVDVCGPALAGRDRLKPVPTLALSALNGRGIERLVAMIRERELAGGEVHHLEIPHDQSRVLAMLHEVAEIHEQHSADRTTRVTAWIPKNAMHNFTQFSVSDFQKRAKVG
jgi:GTP-binding protein HflX